MNKFRKKTVVIEALQYTGASSSEDDIEVFAGRMFATASCDGVVCLVIPALEGYHLARPGDWIIRGIKGELYSCKPDIFDATYEPVP